MVGLCTGFYIVYLMIIPTFPLNDVLLFNFNMFNDSAET